jgi:hypothetical protein
VPILGHGPDRVKQVDKLKKFPIQVIDLTARVGMYALEQLGVSDIKERGLWPTIDSQKLPVNLALGWQRLGYGDTLMHIPAETLAIAVLVGPGSAALLPTIKNWLREKGVQAWVLLAPSAIAEEQIFKNQSNESAGYAVHKLLDSDPKTLWFVLLDLILNAVSQAQSRAPSTETTQPGNNMASNLKQSIDQAMTIDGAMAVALVDYRSGMCLAQSGSALNLDLAAAGNTQVVRAKLQTVEALGLRKGIEDILITLVDQYHLIRLAPGHPGLFLYLVLDKAKGNLALARYKLTEIERQLQV